MANIGKIKKNQLEQDEGTIVGESNLKNYISESYKKLFGDSDTNDIMLDEERINDIPQLTQKRITFLQLIS